MLVTDRQTDGQTATITVCLGSSALGMMTNRQTNELLYAVAPPLCITRILLLMALLVS